MSGNQCNNPYGNFPNDPDSNDNSGNIPSDNMNTHSNDSFDMRKDNQPTYYYRNYERSQDPTSVPSPINYVQSEPAAKKRRRGARGLRTVFSLLIVAAILVGTVGTLSLFYEIVPGDGDIVFSLERIDRRTNQNTVPNAPIDNGEKDKSTTLREVNPNGPVLEINDPPAPKTTPVARESGAVLTVSEIAEKVMPSVVGVVSSVRSLYGTSSYSGTGIIMSSDGYIITNNHVIDSAENISITLMNGKTYDAKLVGRDKRSDLAVIKIEANDLIPAEFGDSDALKVGDLAVAIGNPLGLDLMGTVTDGIISAINRDVVVEERTMTLIQTNAAINSGNSGGPLINKYGQVIGINTLKMQDYYTNVEGLGFAIPTNTAKPIIDELIQYGYVKGRPSIGINVKTISESQARYFNVPQGVGVYYVHPEADAYKKGLQVNDIIVEAQGKEVKSASEINRIKEEYVAGDLFTVKVYRNGKYLEITFELMDEAVIDMSQGSFLVP